MKTGVLPSTVLLLMAGMTLGSEPAYDPLPSFSKEEIAGNWIGYNTTGEDFFKLVLKTNGQSILAQKYKDASVCLYLIPKWDITKTNTLIFELKPCSTNCAPLPLKHADTRRVDISLVFGQRDWSEDVHMLREGTVHQEYGAIDAALALNRK